MEENEITLERDNGLKAFAIFMSVLAVIILGSIFIPPFRNVVLNIAANILVFFARLSYPKM